LHRRGDPIKILVALIQQLYQVENAAADLDPDHRRVLRQAQSGTSSLNSHHEAASQPSAGIRPHHHSAAFSQI